jgi:endonuclease/exonuclease/phosphatase family metal-dependent hydrolase
VVYLLMTARRKQSVFTLVLWASFVWSCAGPTEADIGEVSGDSSLGDTDPVDGSGAGNAAPSTEDAPTSEETSIDPGEEEAGPTIGTAGVDVEFSVMTYNVHALPLDFSIPSRFAEIGDQLAARRAAGTAPDFVVLQEAFVEGVQDLIDRSGYPYFVEGPGPSTLQLNSGLYMLSEYPLLDPTTIIYNKCAVADCGARKGIVAVRVQLPGVPEPIVILTTHMQAHKENDDVRIDQIDQSLSFLSDAGIYEYPSVYAGDFNFKARDDHEAHPSYVHFLANTPYASTGELCVNDTECITGLGPDGNTDEHDLWWSTNDHQFYHAPVVSGYTINPLFFELLFTTPFNGDPLSDHWAVEARYQISNHER